MPSIGLRSELPTLLLALAASIAACGGKVDFEASSASSSADSTATSSGAGGSCPAEPPGGTPAASCHFYCDIFNCLGCASTAAACESACVAQQNDPGPNTVTAQCLACAAQHVSALTPAPSCSETFGAGPNGETNVFTVDYSVSDCPSCSMP